MTFSNRFMHGRSWATVVIVAVLIVAVVWFGFHWHKTTPTESNTPKSTSGVHCGSERWAVKTLSDEEGACVDFTPRHTTVSWLVSQQGPALLPEQSRSGTIECQVWQLTGQMEGFKAEDDGDFHIVVADLEKPDLTMIVEIPDPACSGACASAHGAEIARAREDFTQAFGEPVKRFHQMSQTVIVTVIGVGFFDFKHRQTGLAPNGVELHPVTGFEVNTVPRN